MVAAILDRAVGQTYNQHKQLAAVGRSYRCAPVVGVRWLESMKPKGVIESSLFHMEIKGVEPIIYGSSL